MDFTQERGEVATARLITINPDITARDATKVLGTSADEFTISTWKSSVHIPVFEITVTGLDSREAADAFTALLAANLPEYGKITYRKSEEAGQIIAALSSRSSKLTRKDVEKVLEAAGSKVTIVDWQKPTEQE